jgi:hypothetical protein
MFSNEVNGSIDKNVGVDYQIHHMTIFANMKSHITLIVEFDLK